MTITLGSVISLDDLTSSADRNVLGRAYEMGDGRIVYAWSDPADSLVYFTVHDSAGNEVIGRTQLDAATEPAMPGQFGFLQAVFGVVATAGGGLRFHYVVDEDQLFPLDGTHYVREFDANGTPTGASDLVAEEAPLYTADNSVSIGLSDGNLAVMSDGGLAIIGPDGSVVGGSSIAPGFAGSDNGYDIVETSDGIMVVTADRGFAFSPLGWFQSIEVETFDLSGNSTGSSTIVTSEFAGTETSIVNATIEADVLADGRVVVVYHREELPVTGDDNEISVIILNTDGTVDQGPFLGNPGTTPGPQTYPGVHALEDGGFVVLYETSGDGDNWAVQRFTDAGVPFGDPVGSAQTFSATSFSQYQGIILPDGTGLAIDEAGNATVITIDTSATPPMGPTPGNDDLSGTDMADQIDLLAGNDVYDALGGDDYVFGNAGDDFIFGGAGQDTLEGGDGNDTLDGGGDGDVLDGGDGYDIADYGSADRSVRVDLQNPAISFNDAAGDTFISIEEYRTGDGVDQLRGDTGDNIFRTGGVSDRLYGRAGDDMLFGEAGADAFYGGLGADIMTGGDDAGRRDRYIYFNAAESGVGDGQRDVITDYVAGEDRIELSRIDADLTQGFKQRFDFIGDDPFSGTGGELRFEQIGGNTIVQADRDGDGVADFEIELTGTMTLTDSDFLI